MPAALFAANSVPWTMTDHVTFVPEQPIYWSNASSRDNVVSVDFKRKIVREAASEPVYAAWQEVAASRLDRLRAYVQGWDGPASLPISHDALARGGRLLALAFENLAHPAPPAAVPCADGSLQLEWWLTDTRFELSIEANGATYAWAQNRLTGEETEAEGKDATNLLFGWARRLTADKLIQVA